MHVQLARDAEMLSASEVALLPLTLLKLYKDRSVREKQAVVTHDFFETLAKPWALQPSKLSKQASRKHMGPETMQLLQAPVAVLST